MAPTEAPPPVEDRLETVVEPEVAVGSFQEPSGMYMRANSRPVPLVEDQDAEGSAKSANSVPPTQVA